jgi:hypothetical protein
MKLILSPMKILQILCNKGANMCKWTQKAILSMDSFCIYDAYSFTYSSVYDITFLLW